MRIARFAVLLGATLMAACGGATSASTGHIDGLQIDVGPNWREAPSSDPEQRSFLSVDGGIGITISSLAINVKPEQTEQVAARLAQSRLEGHQSYERETGGHATITEPVFQEHSWGHHIEYDGESGDARVFSFVGFVTTKQVVSIFAEGPASKFGPPNYMHTTIQEFISSVKFEMPAIR